MNDEDFEWDDAKNVSNDTKHGVTFERARLVFSDPFGIGEFDDRPIEGEDRFTVTGMVAGVLLLVAYTERRGRIRIISARRATKHERDDYFRQNRRAP